MKNADGSDMTFRQLIVASAESGTGGKRSGGDLGSLRGIVVEGEDCERGSDFEDPGGGRAREQVA